MRSHLVQFALTCCCANAALLPAGTASSRGHPMMVTASGMSSPTQKASSTLPDRQLSRVEGWTLLCDRLQAGESASGLEGTLATAAGREGFFGVYLSDPAYTMADAAAPPVALIDAVIDSRPQAVASVSTCLAIVAIAVDNARAARNGGDDAAASASELTVARACTLLDAMCARVDGATCAAFRIQQVHAARGSRLSGDSLQALGLNELGI
jgi:hypothetical protein